MITPTSVEILLVEDNPADAELTLRALRKNNVTNRVEVIRDGAEAMEYLCATGRYADHFTPSLPKVILLDLKLPFVSGIEVLRRCKTDERLRRIPIVMLTSSREEPDIQICYNLGANSYIVKPVDFQQFTDAVRQAGLYWLLLNEPPNLQ
ncbi:MAG: two-component system response regulator [Nitrospira sp. WS110]|nr:two-component system response regulator [Nitrospira sp. WS110]